MRKGFLYASVVLVAGVVLAAPGCKEREKKKEGESSPAKEESAAPEKPQTKIVWTCGMPGHPVFDEANKPADGKCPQCGMKLVEKEIPAPQQEQTYWTCPMHPEVREKGPGNCPKCGMKLVQKKVE
jgi:rubrerythrin